MTRIKKNKITIITGEKGAGKSLFISKLLNGIKEKGLILGGLYSPGIYKGGKKIGIAVENLRTCEKKMLASHAPGWDPEMPLREWKFNENAVSWGNDVLTHQALPCDILVVDEIGYLELEKGKGWTSIFNILKRDDYLYGYIVVRENLLPLALGFWEHARVIRISEIGNTRGFIENELAQIKRNIRSDR